MQTMPLLFRIPYAHGPDLAKTGESFLVLPFPTCHCSRVVGVGPWVRSGLEEGRSFPFPFVAFLPNPPSKEQASSPGSGNASLDENG